MNTQSDTTPSLLMVDYADTGEELKRTQLVSAELDVASLNYFVEQTSRLSGDLELPREGHLPGEIKFLEYRIGSDLNGAYTLYYYHDEVVHASLYLRGRDPESETELMQVFKYLLLDDQDLDEPTDEELDDILASNEFDFEKTTRRPVAFSIPFKREGVEPSVYHHIYRMDQHLAWAFCHNTDDAEGTAGATGPS